jgi:Flp pilus assembly protein TadD
MIETRFIGSRPARLMASVALIAGIAAVAAGCVTTRGPQTTGSLAAGPAPNGAALHGDIAAYGQQYSAKPTDPDAALRYAEALRANGQYAQAAAVLERASMVHPDNKALLGEYGRALADTGDYQQAFTVLSHAHSPDQPDWHILSAQGAVLDQMGRHAEARRYYLTALKIAPNEPSVLSNLGLSYALSHNLPAAEKALRRAVAQHPADPRVQQNLALVVGLQGRFAEAEAIARADLTPDQAAANIAYLRQMLSSRNALGKRNRSARRSGGEG